MVEGILTTIVTEFDVADDPVRHAVALDVITTVTTSLLLSADDVKVALPVPAFMLFTFHWYDGDDPPLTGVAVKLTVVPAHIGLAEAAMLTPA